MPWIKCRVQRKWNPVVQWNPLRLDTSRVLLPHILSELSPKKMSNGKQWPGNLSTQTSLEMKCFSAAIRTVCLVLSVQIVALSDAKSIGPSSVASLSPSPFSTQTSSSSSSTGGGGDGLLPATTTTLVRENEWTGANDPPFPSGQEHRSGTNYSSSRFVRYVPKYSIDHLLEHYYEFKISNDIDLDPCKTGNN